MQLYDIAMHIMMPVHVHEQVRADCKNTDPLPQNVYG